MASFRTPRELPSLQCRWWNLDSALQTAWILASGRFRAGRVAVSPLSVSILDPDCFRVSSRRMALQQHHISFFRGCIANQHGLPNDSSSSGGEAPNLRGHASLLGEFQDGQRGVLAYLLLLLQIV